MTVKAQRVTVTTSPTLLTRGEGLAAKSTVALRNLDGAVTVFLGGPSVDANGFPLKPDEVMIVDLDNEDVFGFVNAGSASVAVMETSL